MSPKKNNCEIPYCIHYSGVLCSFLSLCTFGWAEATMCNRLFMHFGGCTMHFGGFCVCMPVYIEWPVVAQENGKSFQQKKSILLCGSSVVTPVLSTADVHEVVGSYCLGRIQCSATCDCKLPADSKVKGNCKDSQCDYIGFGFLEKQAKSPLSLSYKMTFKLKYV